MRVARGSFRRAATASTAEATREAARVVIVVVGSGATGRAVAKARETAGLSNRWDCAGQSLSHGKISHDLLQDGPVRGRWQLRWGDQGRHPGTPVPALPGTASVTVRGSSSPHISATLSSWVVRRGRAKRENGTLMSPVSRHRPASAARPFPVAGCHPRRGTAD